jgi:hypothetical protein
MTWDKGVAGVMKTALDTVTRAEERERPAPGLAHANRCPRIGPRRPSSGPI